MCTRASPRVDRHCPALALRSNDGGHRGYCIPPRPVGYGQVSYMFLSVWQLICLHLETCSSHFFFGSVGSARFRSWASLSGSFATVFLILHLSPHVDTGRLAHVGRMQSAMQRCIYIGPLYSLYSMFLFRGGCTLFSLGGHPGVLGSGNASGVLVIGQGLAPHDPKRCLQLLYSISFAITSHGVERRIHFGSSIFLLDF